MPGYAAALASLSDAQLGCLLRRRPDLLVPPAPASFAELANRAGSPASLAAALRSLDLAALQLAELLAVVGLPTTVQALAAAAGPGLSPERLRHSLAALTELGLAIPAGDQAESLSGPRGLHAPFGNPGRLGPSVVELAKVGVQREQLDRIATHLDLPIDRPARIRPQPRRRAGHLAA